MLRGQTLTGLVVIAFAWIMLGAASALAEDTVKIGLILPMTGQQASVGKQLNAAVHLFIQQNGTHVGAKPSRSYSRTMPACRTTPRGSPKS